jgi:tetraprenyl-beta-curcumene synthase
MADKRANPGSPGRLRVWAAFAWTVPLYWLAIFPQARRELRSWERRAARIPCPMLRAHALGKLGAEGLTAEGAAAFAIVATARSCRDVVRLAVALEVIYDYIDALGEQPVADPLANNRCLYRALGAALAPGAPAEDHYRHHPQQDDGGYLRELIEACNEALLRLPTHETVLPALQRYAARAGEAQSLHHAAAHDGEAALARWAASACPAAALDWWELAAAAGSPLGFYALAAAAAHPATTAADATAVEQAYFPWIAALSWLLESLVDQDDDRGSGEHSYIAHYATPGDAAVRLTRIAERASADAAGLPRGSRHLLLLAGMAGMYLSHAGAAGSDARDAAAAVHRAIGGPLALLLWTLRLRRRLAGLRLRRRAAPHA